MDSSSTHRGGIGASVLVTRAMLPATASADARSGGVRLENLSSPTGIDIGLGPCPGRSSPTTPGYDRVTESPAHRAIQPHRHRNQPARWHRLAISSADQTLYHQLADETVVPILDVPEYQTGDPDPVDNEGIPGDRLIIYAMALQAVYRRLLDP